MKKSIGLSHRLGIEIRILRINKGLTQSNFGKEIGLTNVAIHNYESGKNGIPIERLELISQFFGLTLTELINKANGEKERS